MSATAHAPAIEFHDVAARDARVMAEQIQTKTDGVADWKINVRSRTTSAVGAEVECACEYARISRESY